MKGLSAVPLCIALAIAPVACGQDKGKATTGTKATTQAQSKEPEQKKAPTKAQKKATTEKKAPTQAQKKATTEKKAPTQAQKKQQDRMGDCNKQANLKNMRGEDRKTFVSKCLSG
ncbi:MAG TPA: PsiF family protein [Burkholderiales bacterium]|jgi:uncharacterized protein HemX|nr:PsiF family protein [Burkholderiales bacterium]